MYEKVVSDERQRNRELYKDGCNDGGWITTTGHYQPNELTTADWYYPNYWGNTNLTGTVTVAS